MMSKPSGVSPWGPSLFLAASLVVVTLAYWIGQEAALDRLLLASSSDQARALAEWIVPRLPMSGGQLIKRGVTEGPLVARTLKAIERACRIARVQIRFGETVEGIRFARPELDVLFEDADGLCEPAGPRQFVSVAVHDRW